MNFKKQVRDFLSTNRTVMSVQESQGAKDDVIAAYVAGAKEQAKSTQRVGEMLQRVAVALTPQEVSELCEIFNTVKEINDEQ